MNDQENQSVGVPADEEAGLSQLQRVTNTFTAPSKTFEDIKRGNRSWWLPFVILAIASYILFAAITFKVGWRRWLKTRFISVPRLKNGWRKHLRPSEIYQ
jgi:hypothetical protein